MKYSSRFFLYAPLGVFLLLAAAVSIHWWIAASALSDRLEAENGHALMPGVTLSYASRRTSGFPFSLDTEFHDVSFTVATPHGPTTWHADKFAMHALTYGRDKTIFEAAGPQMLSWTRDDGERRVLAFAVGSLHASAIEAGGALSRFDLDLVGFGSKALTAQRLQLHIRRSPDGGFDVFATADGVVLSAVNRTALGERIDTARLSGTFRTASALDALAAATMAWPAAAQKWRQAHGVFVVKEIRLFGNTLRAAGSGELSFDGSHRPAGGLVLTVGDLPRYLKLAAQQKLPAGPEQGLAAALIAGADSHEANTVLLFRDGKVMVDGVRADTLAPLY